MPTWLYESASTASESVVGFGVLDALGMRIGTVEGWVRTPEGAVAYLEVAHRSVLRENRHLVPLGYVVQVDPGRRYVHLRELTRRTLPLVGVRFDDRRLPDETTLAEGLRHTPAARTDVVNLLLDPAHGVAALVPERIAVRRDPRYAEALAAAMPPPTGSPVAAGDAERGASHAPSWTRMDGSAAVASAPASPAELRPWRSLTPENVGGDSSPF